MPATMTLTPRPDLAAFVLNINTDGLTLTSLVRYDANASPRAVRLDAGTLPTTNPPVIVDYEPALSGQVTYVARFSNGSTANAWSSPTGLGVTRPWLSVPLWPEKSVSVDLVTSYSAARRSGNVYHEIIDRVDPAVTLAPLRTRSGTLEVWCPDYSTAAAVVAVHDLAQVCYYRQPDIGGIDTYYAVDGLIDLEPHAPREGAPVRWRVRIPYREVGRPTGDLIANTGWTFAAVAAEFTTLADLPATFDTFADLALEVRS